MAQLILDNRTLEQATEQFRELVAAVSAAEGRFAALAGRVDELGAIFSQGISLQRAFAADLENVENRVNSFMRSMLSERLENISNFVSEGIDLHGLLAGGIESAEKRINRFLVDTLAQRFTFLQNHIGEGIDLHNLLADGINMAEGRVTDFLQEKLGERIAFLQEHLDNGFDLQEIFGAKIMAAEEGLNEFLHEILGERFADLSEYFALGLGKANKFAEGMRKTEEFITQFTGANNRERLDMITDVLREAGRSSRAAAMAYRAIAIVEAGIDTARAVVRTLATAPWPANIGMAAAVGIQGARNIAQIRSSSIPSAETGGRFIVPDVYPVNRVDSALMRVNPGEEVNVTPRGSNADMGNAHYTFVINDQVIFDIVTKGIRSGDIVLAPAANL